MDNKKERKRNFLINQLFFDSYGKGSILKKIE